MSKIERDKIELGVAGASSDTSAVATAAIDMQGYEGIVAFARIATANAGNFLEASQCDTSGGTYKALVGAKAVGGTNGDLVVVEVHKPKERFLKFTITRGAATVTGDLMIIRYGSRKEPVVSGNVRAFVSMPEEAP